MVSAASRFVPSDAFGCPPGARRDVSAGDFDGGVVGDGGSFSPPLLPLRLSSGRRIWRARAVRNDGLHSLDASMRLLRPGAGAGGRGRIVCFVGGRERPKERPSSLARPLVASGKEAEEKEKGRDRWIEGRRVKVPRGLERQGPCVEEEAGAWGSEAASDGAFWGRRWHRYKCACVQLRSPFPVLLHPRLARGFSMRTGDAVLA